MRNLTLAATAAALIALSLALSAAAAPQGVQGARGPDTRIICLDVGGETRPALCRASSSRIDQSDIICICENAQRVSAPVCSAGERPQAESRLFEKARKLAAKDGSLVGDLYEGRRMCIRARNG
jgi:hypothetical protein